ncbi:ECHM protein, partial [Polypterus senegalus]|nr:ECHM protein [Polypterus senegalus]
MSLSRLGPLGLTVTCTVRGFGSARFFDTSKSAAAAAVSGRAFHASVWKLKQRAPGPSVLVERHGSICSIGINRPEARNAVNLETGRQLVEAFKTFEGDSSLTAAVFHGIGGHFCAGFDLKELCHQREALDVEQDVTKGPGPMLGGPNHYRITEVKAMTEKVVECGGGPAEPPKNHRKQRMEPGTLQDQNNTRKRHQFCSDFTFLDLHSHLCPVRCLPYLHIPSLKAAPPPPYASWSDLANPGPSRMQFTKPVIAAVSGYAVAGGLELSLLADLRVMEESAITGVFCRRFGVPLIDGGTVRLPQLIGLSRALDLILTGRPVGAQEALHFGIANRVVPDGKGLECALDLAERISCFPQECLRADRSSAYHSVFDAPSFTKAMQFEFDNAKHVLLSEAITGADKFSSGIGKGGKFF